MKKKTAKADATLREALAASFQPGVHTPTQTSGAVTQPPNEQHSSTPAEKLPSSSLRKTTISFQSDEQHQIDQILDLLLRQRRHRGGFSDAVKIALRLCPLDGEQIGKAWDAARAEDRRTKRHQ